MLCLLVYIFQLFDLALHKQFSGVINPYTDQFVIVVFIILVDFLALWAKCCIVNKRLKDIGKSSWLLVLSLIPFVCFVFDIYLCLKRGDSNSDEDTPKNENNTNFKKAFCVLLLINSFVEYYLFFCPFSNTHFADSLEKVTSEIQSNVDGIKSLIPSPKMDFPSLSALEKKNIADLLPGVARTLPTMTKPPIESRELNNYEVRWCLARVKILDIIVEDQYQFVPNALKEYLAAIDELSEICPYNLVEKHFDSEKLVVDSMRNDLNDMVKEWIMGHYRRSNTLIDLYANKNIVEEIKLYLSDLGYNVGVINSQIDDKFFNSVYQFKQQYGVGSEKGMTEGSWALLQTLHQQYLKDKSKEKLKEK